MQFSKLAEIKTSKDVVSTFGGYNHNLTIADGEFYDMKNMTSSYYPALSPRVKRGLYTYPGNTKTTHKINGILSKDVLCYVDGTDLYIGEQKVSGITLTDSKKQLVSMGAYLIIMPDKKFVNTKKLSDLGSIDRTWTSGNNNVTISQCDIDGNEYNILSKTATVPSEPSDKDCYIDTSSGIDVIKQYNALTKKWVAVETPYIKIVCSGLQTEFKNGDQVVLTGFNTTTEPMFSELEGKRFNAAKIVSSTTDDNVEQTIIIIPHFFDKVSKPTLTNSITVTATMPKLDFIIESNNRLWGCRYGNDLDGNFVNEIYASKLGDFRSWTSFDGTSMDSYTVSCGSDGPFTGAIVHLGKPLFFKENYIHKVYGSFPSEYQVQTTVCKGVMKGASQSLSVVNESVMYKSRNGICLYDGSIPQEVSDSLGEIKYTAVDSNEDELRNGAVGGLVQNKYYISMKSEIDNKWYLFAFDVNNGLWHKEDNTRADVFCNHNGELYFIDNSDKAIKTILGTGTKETKPIEWELVTGIIGTKLKTGKYSTSMLTGKKYISQLLIRMSIELETKAYFYIQYDSMGEWEHVTTIMGNNTRSFTVPIRPKRCDHFRVKIVGSGDMKIFSIAKTIEQGSDC